MVGERQSSSWGWLVVVSDGASGVACGCCVVDVVDDESLELAPVPDEGAIGEFTTQ